MKSFVYLLNNCCINTLKWKPYNEKYDYGRCGFPTVTECMIVWKANCWKRSKSLVKSMICKNEKPTSPTGKKQQKNPTICFRQHERFTLTLSISFCILHIQFPTMHSYTLFVIQSIFSITDILKCTQLTVKKQTRHTEE